VCGLTLIGKRLTVSHTVIIQSCPPLTTKEAEPGELTVVLDYCEAKGTYSRIGLLRSYGNLQWYWTTTKLWELTVVLDYYEAMETYSRIELLRSDVYLQSY
jgi:hypothetical protein